MKKNSEPILDAQTERAGGLDGLVIFPERDMKAIASMTIEEVDAELLGLGLNPNQSLPESLARWAVPESERPMLLEARWNSQTHRQEESGNHWRSYRPVHVETPDEPVRAWPHSEIPSNTTLEIIHPEDSKSRKKVWVLTREAFDYLLDNLDPDRDVAARRYEMIRAKLVRYFECRGCLIPEELADDTINRVTRRLYEGCQIWASEPASYFYGVARNVLKEYWTSPEREFTPLESLSPYGHPKKPPVAESEEAGLEDDLKALAACLDQLPPESRELIISYYRGEKCERKRQHKQMAAQLGIPLNALRIRVHRIRERPERSFRNYKSSPTRVVK